tara:strand:+ start:3037 stop:4095 length:1059 start_codon:yes stop_codon:yes gene_type:complete
MKSVSKCLIITFLSFHWIQGQCDSGYTYFDTLPSNVHILAGDTCLYDLDLDVLSGILELNENLPDETPLEIGTQTWINNRLKILVAGKYYSGVDTHLVQLPDNMGNWDAMTALYLEWNHLTSLPESLGDMSSLYGLYVSNNWLEYIPESIGNIEGLYFLDLGYNYIESIPTSICDLSNLTHLLLFNNSLSELPDCFCDLDLNWDDFEGDYPFFAIGGNQLCENVPDCVANSANFEISLDQYFYTFPIYAPQECDSTGIELSYNFPESFSLSNPYPNPFNPRTTLEFSLPFQDAVEITVFNMLGQAVEILHKGELNAGSYRLFWDGTHHPSGVYFFKLEAGDYSEIQQGVLIK